MMIYLIPIAAAFLLLGYLIGRGDLKHHKEMKRFWEEQYFIQSDQFIRLLKKMRNDNDGEGWKKL